MDSDTESESSFELPEDGSSHDGGNGGITPISLTRAQALNLYVSHAFSTWNARGYEFAAVCLPEEAARWAKFIPAHHVDRSSSRQPHILIPL